MPKKSLQRITEEKTKKFLFKIVSELDLEARKIPFVRYLYKNLEFEDLFLKEKERASFDWAKEKKSNCFLINLKTILIGNLNDFAISEESSHFLHYSILNEKFHKRNHLDAFSYVSLSETIGFFCSKRISPERENFHKKDKYLIPTKNKNSKKTLQIIIKNVGTKNHKKLNNLIYGQGYTMGEELFNKHKAEKITKKEITDLMKKPLKENFEAAKEFLKWKYYILK